MDGAVRKVSRLLLCTRNKFARFVEGHFFSGMKRLAELVCESLNEVRPRTNENARRADFHGDCNERSPSRMHAKTKRRLFQVSHCQHLLRRRAFHNLPHYFARLVFVLRVTEYFCSAQSLCLYAVSEFMFLERQADAPDQSDIFTGPNQR